MPASPSLRLALAAMAVATLTGSMGAQPTGTIEGRVQNEITGRYLNNAQVVVKGTRQVALTDDFGVFRLTDVPAGPAVLEFLYTGLDPQQLSVNVAPAATVVRDVTLTSAALFARRDATVKLDAFTVAATKETDGSSIAINDQRFAPNIRNVVSTDAHGEVMGGNIGEFLKFVPGLDTGGGAFEPGAISVRGFSSAMTLVTSDGAPLANSGGDRAFTLEQISINNISRVEVTKMPTPATPADSVSGSVNMVSRSAFELSRRELRYNVNLTASQRHLQFGRQPRADETYTHLIRPSASLELAYPVSRNLGLTFAALHYMGNVPYNSPLRTFEATAAGTGASYARPYLRQVNTQITTQFRTRDSVSAKVDWRVAPHSVLSASYQQSYFNLDSLNYNFQGNVGTAPTPAVAGGTPLSFGPDFVVGATGRGSLGQTAGFNTRHQWLSSGNLSYRLDNGRWRVDALATASKAKSWTTREEEGYFGGFTTSPKVPVRISFLDIDEIGPGRTEVFTNSNQPFDLYDLNNYNLTGVSGGRRSLIDTMRAGHLNVKRRLDLLGLPASLQAGWAGRGQTRDLQNFTRSYTYNGVNGDLSASRFQALVYANIREPLITGIERHPPAGRGVPYASPHLAFQAYRKDPGLFSITPAQAISMESGRRTNSLYFEEGVDALYLQGELRLFSNRLNVLAGARYERTTSVGQGVLSDPNAVWVRNPDGTYARNPAGQRIRRAEAGATGSLEQLNLTTIERGYRASRSYDGTYPSVHFTWNVRENLLARLAYAATYGRPNYAEIVPNTVINEADLGTEPDPSAVRGTLTVRNTGLRPWTADNLDFSLEYYTAGGGLLAAGLFHKGIRDFFGTFARVATAADVAALGLDPRYAGWQVNTTINTGRAQVSGVELSANQPLHVLGEWGRPFKVFANLTRIGVRGDNEADFSGFLPRALNYGLTFSRRGLIVMAKWHQRADVAQDPQPYLGPDARAFVKGRTILDLNLSFWVLRGTSLFVNVRNALGERVDYLRYGSQTPAHAIMYQPRNYGGATLDAGIKGTF
jgi:iron complex outermembrane receptor protein